MDDRVIHTPAAVCIVVGTLVPALLIGAHLHYDNERQIERLRTPPSEWTVEVCER